MRRKRERDGGSVGPGSRSQVGEDSVIKAAVGVLSHQPLPTSEKKISTEGER
jgi:hypothetical protein